MDSVENLGYFQNYGPFLAIDYITAPKIQGAPKEDVNFGTLVLLFHWPLLGAVWVRMARRREVDGESE